MHSIAQPTDLIISEYIEGSSNNKFIELYNGTAGAINLANYQLRLHANGSVGVTQLMVLSGSLASGATIVYGNTSSTIYAGAYTPLNTVCNFNGDDAIVLWKIAPAGYVDIVGNVGCDPGTSWNDGTRYTVNQTLVRNFNVCSGVTVDPATSCPFPTLTAEWTNYPIDDASNLGSHFMDCSPNVNFLQANSTNLEGTGGPTAFVVGLSVFPASTGGTVVISMTNGPGVAYTTDYTVTGAGVTVLGSDITVSLPNGATSASFTVNVVGDASDEGNELITFAFSSSTGGISLGPDQIHDFTINDDDGPPAVSFSTLSANILEGFMTTINLGISPLSPNPTTVQILVAAGPGVVFDPPPYAAGGDYYTVPLENGSQIITVTIPAGMPSVSFDLQTWNDGVEDLPSLGYESITFTINSAVSPPGLAAVGSPNSMTVYITDQNATPTVLSPGDLMIVGVNANNGACSGNSTEDIVSFFCFKTLARNTKLILTDNGYDRCSLGTWGNNEGTVEMTRTGLAIPAGKVITFRIRGMSGAGNVTGLAPDGAWTCTSLNGFTSVDMNSSGDQLFFMQGGVWNPGGAPGTHNATYTGTPLYGFSTVPAPNSWISLPPSCTTSGANSRSGLPLNMKCFSMAPTGGTAFNKFTFANILTFSASQRDWMIRADNNTYWVNPANCTAYSAQYPNWTLSPTLNITPAPFVPGLWRGTTNTDWFECKNWDDITVPVATTNVRIDETSTNHCVVGVTPGGNAVCSSLLQTNSGAPRYLTVQGSSSLAIGGPLTIERTTAGTAIYTTVTGNSVLTATNFSIQGSSPAAVNEAVFRNLEPTNIVTFSNNFTIGAGGWVNLQGAGVGGNIFLGGNYQNDGPTEATLGELYGTITLNGAGAQSVGTSGFQEVFGNFTVAKSAGDVTLNSPLAVRGVLNLSTGVLNTSSPGGLLTMRAGSSWINATDNSFVNGPMEKVGLTNFTFPIGKVNNMRPCGIQGIVGFSTSAFLAEYFPISSYAAWGIAREPTLHHLSDCEYWTIDRSASTPTATIVLTWEAPASCGVDNPSISELRVARWDDAAIPAPGIWRDRGNGGATGTSLSGSIPTFAAQTTADFNASETAWTLASITANNPLPITLVDFTAAPQDGKVRLDWTTASEFDNALFIVERSRDGVNFEPVLDVPGALFSTVPLDYTEFDRTPYPGLSYYRLRQVDVDGTSTLSRIVAVLFGGMDTRPLVVFGNADVLTAIHGFPAGSSYELMDMTGRLIVGGSTTMDGRTELNGLALSRGAYLMRLHNGDRVESTRFVY